MKSKELEKIIIFTTITISMTVVCGLITFTILKYFNNKIIRKTITQLREQIIEEDNINWKELNKINEDIVGWIKIEGTDIDYPILKSENLSYLRYNYDKTYNLNGSICTKGDLSFKEKETVLYGTNMKNDLMFSKLKNYLQEDFFSSHNTFYIYTPNYAYRANVVGCYSFKKNEEENIKFNFTNEEIIVKLCSYSYDDAINYVVATIVKI